MTAQEKILRKLLAERILLLDGAMGTMIQQHKLTEEDYRGGREGRFAKFSGTEGKRELFLKGNNELLSLTQPLLVRPKLHKRIMRCQIWLMK
jgi:5-methyltetrahydrofolate--homocysteine methyltransferase